MPGFMSPVVLLTYRTESAPAPTFVLSMGLALLSQTLDLNSERLTNASTLSAVSFKAAVAATSIAALIIIIDTLCIHITQTSHVVAVFLYPWTALISTAYTAHIDHCHSMRPTKCHGCQSIRDRWDTSPKVLSGGDASDFVPSSRVMVIWNY